MADTLVGDYNASGFSISNFDTCVSKDQRPGFEGHQTVTAGWDLHPASGMNITCIVRTMMLCLGGLVGVHLLTHINELYAYNYFLYM